MAFVLKDRVKETSTTTGTGTFTLGGASAGYQGFSTVGNANTTFYSIVMGTEWENGVGTYTSSGSTLSRDTVLSSSNSGNKVNFSAGTKDVFINYPAGRASLYDTPSQSTGAFHIPVGTTDQRPTGATGMIRLNSTTGSPEWYDAGGERWSKFTEGPQYSANVLIVAGGGSGGMHSGGGGGAGGLLYYGSETPKTPNGSALALIPGTNYTVTVGAGGSGSGGPYQSVAGNGFAGSNSVFGAYTAIGGGRGGSGGNSVNASSGGSGGGGGRTNGLAGSGTTGQGFGGGYPNTGDSPNYPGGGGGGASQAGGNGSTTAGGNGGNGLQYSISGTATYYAGGGGGNLQQGSPAGTGGLGGGGNGGLGLGSTSGAGTVNTGGGSGGANYDGSGSLSGGSGIVIISYAGSQRGTGGTVTSSGGNTIHTFTSSGTYTA
jgi:hypothetical protein